MSDTDDWVTIRHPKHGDNAATSRVRRKAYNRVWAGKGFEIVDPLTVQASTVLGKPVKSLDELTKNEALTVAARSGAQLSGKETKEQLIAAAKKAIESGQEGETVESVAETIAEPVTAGEEKANG